MDIDAAMKNISNVVKGSPKEKGCCATFVRISETVGFKYWWSLSSALASHERQSFAYDNEFGPQVLSGVVTFKCDGSTYYGFFTEAVVELYVQRYDEIFPQYGRYDLPDLRRLASDAGMDLDDIHQDNCGWTKDGRFVCIDFDNGGEF